MNSQQRAGSGPSPTQALLTFRFIGISLGLGVTGFAVVSWLVHRDGGAVEPAVEPLLMLSLMISGILVAFMAAVGLWRARVAPVLESPEPADPVARLGRLQGGVIIVWAVMEAAALLSVVVHYLYDLPLAGAVGVLLIWGTLAATWPKRAWLEASD